MEDLKTDSTLSGLLLECLDTFDEAGIRADSLVVEDELIVAMGEVQSLHET